MKKTPIFPVMGKKIKPADFMRQYHCPHYEACMNEAAIKDRLLDCGSCEYRFQEFKETE